MKCTIKTLYIFDLGGMMGVGPIVTPSVDTETEKANGSAMSDVKSSQVATNGEAVNNAKQPQNLTSQNSIKEKDNAPIIDVSDNGMINYKYV